MLLTQYNMTPCYGFEQAESDVQTALSSVADNSSPAQLLFADVRTGFDAEILDAILATPQPELCPLARVQIFAENDTLAMGGGEVMASVVMQIYVMYYFGVPATDPAFTSYVMLRRRHLTAVLKALQFNQPGVSYGIPQTSRRWWKPRSDSPVMVDLVSPFRYLDKQYTVTDMYNCVRIDWPILVKTAQ